MRARLLMKLVGTVVVLVLSVVAARSCGASPASSPLNPSTVLHNGVAGLCANQAATDAAGGAGIPSTPLQVPVSDSGLAAMAGLAPGALACPTTTVAPAP